MQRRTKLKMRRRKNIIRVKMREKINMMRVKNI